MRPIPQRSLADPVLVLRGVHVVVRVGIPGCRAQHRVLSAVDLVVRRSERVVIVGAPGLAGIEALLLVAAGALRPHSGVVWRAPGAWWRVGDRHVALDAGVPRVVAERRARAIGALCWPEHRAWLTASSEVSSTPRGARVLRLRGGRVDSVLGAA